MALEFEDIEIVGHVGELEEGQYTHVLFKNCQFDRVNLSHRNFRECRFEHCLFNMTTLSAGQIQESVFSECKLIGIDFSECNPLLFSPKFLKSRLLGCVFNRIKAKEISFKGSVVEECSFEEVVLAQADFSEADLFQTIFHHAELKECDFRDATRYTIDPRETKIKGCKFSPPEVVSLLDPFEITID